jgi:hypothetical protein
MKTTLITLLILIASLGANAQCYEDTQEPYSISWLDVNCSGISTHIDYFRLPYAQIKQRPIYYHVNDTVVVPKEYTGTASVSAGIAQYYLTVDGSAPSDSIFTNVNYMKAEVNDADNNYSYTYSLSGDKRTLTVTVKVASVVAGVLTFTAAPNSTPVSVFVKGN